MVDIEKEIESLCEFITTSFPNVKIWTQNNPSTYKAGELALDFLTGSSTDETGYHYRLDRDYQIVYYGATARECLAKMSTLETKFNNAKTTLLKDSTDDFIRFGSFSISRPFKPGGGTVFAIIGVLSAELRVVKSQKQFQKIQNVTARYE